MRGAVIGLALLAGACGGPKTTNDPAAQNVIDATSRGVPAAVAAGTCNSKPDFVPVREDAKFISCTSGKALGRTSGTVIYTSTAEPSTVISWAKEQAIRASLALHIEDGGSFTAGDSKRTLRVAAEPGEARTTVRVNWGVAD